MWWKPSPPYSLFKCPPSFQLQRSLPYLLIRRRPIRFFSSCKDISVLAVLGLDRSAWLDGRSAQASTELL